MGIDFIPTGTALEDFRVLTPDEIKSVETVFTAQGHPLPDPAVSTFVGCVKNGEVLAFLVLQAKLHAEPMWIKDGHAHLFQRLVSTAESVIITLCGPQWVYLFAPAGRVAQMAAAMGMQVEPYVIMCKLVQPSTPAKPTVELTETNNVIRTQ